MQAELVEKHAASATVKVTVPAPDVDAAFERVLRELSRQVRVPGFRPGRAPKGVVVKRIGEDAYREEVRDALVDRSYPQAMGELELSPIHAHFHAEPPAEGEPFTFEVHVDLYPDFELADPDEIVIDSSAEPLTDAQVEETIERLRRENATLVPVDRPAEATDVLSVETVPDDASDEGDDDEGDEGDEGEPAPGSTMPIDLESVGPDLAEQLLGHGIGDVVELRLADPEIDEDDEGDDAESGDDDGDGEGEGDAEASAPRTLRVRILDVKAKEKPDADDEFATTLGFESWDEVEREVRASLQRQIDEQTFEEQRDEFVEKLMEGTEVALPPSMVNRRKLNLLENLGADLERQGTDLKGYLATLDERGTREEFDAELTEAAERGVKRDLVLEKLLERRGAELPDEEFNRAVAHLAAREGADPVRFRRERGEEWLANYRYLLTRDRALREAVREKVGAPESEDGGDDGDDEIVEATSAPAPSAGDGA